MITKSEAEINEIIARWDSNPIWDLEVTIGFEAYRDVLLTHRLKKEAEWKANSDIWESYEHNHLLRRFDELGIVGLMRLLEEHEIEIRDLWRGLGGHPGGSR